MPRRPDLVKASLLAGLVSLWVCLSVPGWTREGIDAPVRLQAAEGSGAAIPSTSLQLVANRLTPKTQSQPQSTATHSPASQSFTLHWFSGGFLGSLL